MLGDDLIAVLPELRAHAESRMLSRVTVHRKTGRKVQNPATGREEPEWAVVHNDLPMRLRGARTGAGITKTTAGEVEQTEGAPEGHFAYDVTDLRDHDFIDVTAGEWAGSVWEVRDASPGGDQQTARRLPLTSVTRPQEW